MNTLARRDSYARFYDSVSLVDRSHEDIICGCEHIANNNSIMVWRDMWGTYRVRLYNVVVLEVNHALNLFVVRHGGWMTLTTKRVINQSAKEFGLDIEVVQRNFQWWILLPKVGLKIPFGVADGGIAYHKETKEQREIRKTINSVHYLPVNTEQVVKRDGMVDYAPK